LILGVIGAGCEGVLDKEPLGRLDAGNFFTTSDDAILALNTAYEPLMINNNNNNFYWVFGTVASDNAIAGGDGSRPGINDIDFFAHNPVTQEFNDFWALKYGGIVQANIVIENTPGVEGDEDLKSRIVAEAIFLRAYYHFLLTQVFGDVPLIIEVQPPDEVFVPRNPREEVLEQIIADCIMAADVLPTSYSASNLGRATAGAALGLKAKAELYLERWNDVVNTVQSIKDLGEYALVENYQDNFTLGAQNNSESVWEIQHTNLELGVGNNLNQWWSSKKVPDGYGFAEVAPEFIDAFEDDDPRLLFTVARNNEEYFGVTYKTSFSSTGASPRKYLQHIDEVSQKPDGDINYTAIRYAEVLLWEAEALVELGRGADALVPLEEVRARARAQASDPSTALPEITTIDIGELRELVRRERRVELGFEMHRFFDLVRWGIAGELLDGFQEGKHEVYPIPQTELDLNPQLDQNPNY
jgi:hypothetical protein